MLWIAAVACGTLLAWLSTLRYLGYNAGMLDLGNMAQAIASVGRGRPLVTTFPDGPTSRLAVHVELIYFLIGVIYPLWNDPRFLLLLQAGLFASAAFPVYALALRRIGSTGAALCVALSYLLYPVAQTSVLFDFHGDTLAMPLLLWALDALDRRAWGRYGVFVALALMCKFYVAVPVAVLGGLVWWRYGERKAALLTTGAAVMYGAFAFGVVRPLFTTASTAQTHRGLQYLWYYFGQTDMLLATLDQRIATAVIVFLPVVFVMRRGWSWLLPGLPIAALVLLSSNGNSFDIRYHHYALVVPFIIRAVVEGIAPSAPDGAAPLDRRRKQGFPPMFIASQVLVIVLIFNIVFVKTPFNPQWWIGEPDQGMDLSSYGVGSRDGVKDRFLAQVPPKVAVAASNFLAPHIADRDTLFLVRYDDDPGGQRLPTLLPQVEYVVTDALFDYRAMNGTTFSGGANYEQVEIGQVLRDPAFGLVAERDGLLLFQRGAAGAQPLTQQVEVVPGSRAETGATIQLADSDIEQIAPRRWRATFEWIAPQDGQRSLVAVSTLDGVPDARMVHLPTYALLPTTRWKPGQRIRETFDVELPANIAPGRYTWRVGWYDLQHSESYLTDGRSQVGSSIVVATVTMP